MLEKNTLKITTAPKFKDEINLDPAASAPILWGPKQTRKASQGSSHARGGIKITTMTHDLPLVAAVLAACGAVASGFSLHAPSSLAELWHELRQHAETGTGARGAHGHAPTLPLPSTPQVCLAATPGHYTGVQ